MQGAKSLATSELLSILLGTGRGVGGLSAVGLGQHILQQLSESQRDPLEMLRDITVQELMSIPGVGTAKATTILAAIELGKRVYRLRPPDRTVIDDSASAVAVLSNELMWHPQEQFATLLQGAQFLNIPLLDHLILGCGSFTSLRQTTSLWQEFPQREIEPFFRTLK